MTADILLEAVLTLGEKLDTERAWREKHSDLVYQAPVVANLSPAQITAGVTQIDTGLPQMGPTREMCWSIRRLNAKGFTAGQADIYINNMEQVEAFYPETAASFYYPRNFYNRGAILLQPGDRLVVNVSGITGSVQIFGTADVFPYWYLRKYLD